MHEQEPQLHQDNQEKKLRKSEEIVLDNLLPNPTRFDRRVGRILYETGNAINTAMIDYDADRVQAIYEKELAKSGSENRAQSDVGFHIASNFAVPLMMKVPNDDKSAEEYTNKTLLTGVAKLAGAYIADEISICAAFIVAAKVSPEAGIAIKVGYNTAINVGFNALRRLRKRRDKNS